MAKQQKPERWSGDTRDWSHQDIVLLNPDRKLRQLVDDNTLRNAEAA